MFSKELENLIEIALTDGVLTDQEKSVLIKRAQKEGVDIDEMDIYIQSLLQKRHQKEAEEDAIKDRMSKVGNVRKCPNCGELVPPGAAKCPSCGLSFDQAETSGAYEKFFKKISETTVNTGFFGSPKQTIQEVSTYIQSYPVPNNRLDLLEFLTNLRPLSNSQTFSAIYKNPNSAGQVGFYGLHYWQLYKNCIAKAKRNFSNDPEFQEFFDFYESESVREKEKGLKVLWNKLDATGKIGCVSGLIVFLGFPILFLLISIIGALFGLK